ncbi:MAG: MaoC family dehydratase N-terminal domain-containing protein [Parasporobacterium sp.]|nr:MaoC family dehydratase N-terminal domain-containing protein [Parasporobacterium sp.]
MEMQKIHNREEWNAAIDKWQANYNKNIGMITKNAIGFYPPVQEDLNVDETGYMNTLVTKDLIRHYADATGDTNPLWRDENYARTTRWGEIIAPPRFLDFISPSYGGIPIPFCDIPGMIPLNGGNSVKWFKPIRIGDRFSVIDKFAGCVETTKPNWVDRRMFNIKSDRYYINQRDEVVAISGGNIICPFNYLPEGADAKDLKNPFDGITRHHFTEEELQAIYDNYEHEFRRGREVLFWENVQEGEELPTLAKGPITVEDALAFFAGVGYCSAFKVKDMFIKAHPHLNIPDPDTGAACPPSLIHISDRHAQQQGMPYAIDFGAQTEGNICHMICNWMGDDGFLKYLYCQARRINVIGDLNWIKGKVDRKYVDEDGDHVVALKVWAENQDGIVFMPGDAIVKLVTKEGRYI